jgi:hypothetical protein
VVYGCQRTDNGYSSDLNHLSFVARILLARDDNIEAIGFGEGELTDDQFRHLCTICAQLPRLRHVSLINTNISDNSVESFRHLARSESIYIYRTRVTLLTDGAIDRIRELCPGSKISAYPARIADPPEWLRKERNRIPNSRGREAAGASAEDRED